MTTDIKAVVAELERLEREWHAAPQMSYSRNMAFTLYCDALWNHCPSIIAELRRLWAIEEAAVRYRDELRKWEAWMAHGLQEQWWGARDEARDALFAALPPRKPSGGEEAK